MKAREGLRGSRQPRTRSFDPLDWMVLNLKMHYGLAAELLFEATFKPARSNLPDLYQID